MVNVMSWWYINRVCQFVYVSLFGWLQNFSRIELRPGKTDFTSYPWSKDVTKTFRSGFKSLITWLHRTQHGSLASCKYVKLRTTISWAFCIICRLLCWNVLNLWMAKMRGWSLSRWKISIDGSVRSSAPMPTLVPWHYSQLLRTPAVVDGLDDYDGL